MEEPALLELIDQYLMGSIRPEDKVELERMMSSDPELAALVNESRKAFSVLQSARNRQMRERLKALDKEESRRSGFLPNWSIVMICILVVIGGSWCWASYHFSNKAIAARFYKMTYSSNEEMVFTGDMKMIWEEAGNAFTNEDFGHASNLYNSFLERADQSFQHNARWNLLLSDLALHGQTEDWKKAINLFAREAPISFSTKANELLRFLNSGWYKIIATCTQTDISGLKPRLI